jgi:hypothetical protein
VISHLFQLEYLDDSVVTAEEREAARKIYGKRRLSTLTSVGKTTASQVCTYVSGWVWLVGVAYWHGLICEDDAYEISKNPRVLIFL